LQRLQRLRRLRVGHWVALGALALTGVLFLGGLLGGISPVQAQSPYPPRLDAHLNDYAELLTPEDAATVRDLYRDLEQQTGIDGVVLTIGSIGSYSSNDSTIEAFATNLFNTWGIGDAARNDGVLMLVAVDDRQMRIELGAGYDASYDARMQRIIDSQMLPAFREDNYSGGIVQGSRALVAELMGQPPGDRGGILGFIDSIRWTLGRIGGVAIATIGGVFAGFAAIVAAVARSYLRNRPRHCPECKGPMMRLTEATDDLHLDAGQQLEEKINAVDYDVWKCPSCDQYTIHRYRNFFSRYSRCPRCRYRPLSTTRHTLRRATYSHSGRERVTKDCRHCDSFNEYTRTIPRRRRSSSRSGGGGRSSGGGASGSW
jgi:uncharacterized protein